jgi:hypothetical protein
LQRIGNVEERAGGMSCLAPQIGGLVNRFGQRRQRNPEIRQTSAELGVTVTDDDLINAERLLRRFDQAMQGEGSMQQTLVAIARAGGALTTEQMFQQASRRWKKFDASEHLDAVWNWWAAVAREARVRNHAYLPAQILGFLVVWRDQLLPKTTMGDLVELNMSDPTDLAIAVIASNALISLRRLREDEIIAGTQTDSINAGALQDWAAVTLVQLADGGKWVPPQALTLAEQRLDRPDPNRFD